MTTKYEAPDWAGLTVGILANGPELTQELADRARAECDKLIAVNRAIRFAQTADMFVALDPDHHADLPADFAGLRIVGAEWWDIDAMNVGPRYEMARLGPSHEVHIRNNLLTAIRLAAEAGAARIVLYAVNTEAYEAAHNFRGLTEGLAAVIAELRAKGVEIVMDGEQGNEPVAIIGQSLE